MVSVLEVCKLNDQTVKEFKGTKEYVATGGIEKDKIVSFTKLILKINLHELIEKLKLETYFLLK